MPSSSATRLTFLLATTSSTKKLEVALSRGCLGEMATSGGLAAAGAIVTPSNPAMCGNLSNWWGFAGRRNVDGLLRELAGPGLAAECALLSPIAPESTTNSTGKLLPGRARSTGAHRLLASKLIHVLPPSNYHHSPQESEGLLRAAYQEAVLLAEAEAMTRLAVPALGCGVFRIPPAVSAVAAFDAVDAAAAAPAVQTLSAIEFVLKDHLVFRAFAAEAKARKRWAAGGSRPSS